MSYLENFFFLLLCKKQSFFLFFLKKSIGFFNDSKLFTNYDYFLLYNTERSKINPYVQWRMKIFHKNWFKPYHLLLFFYNKLLEILKNIYKLRFFVKYWHFISSIPKTHLKNFFRDKYNDQIKTLLYRSSYFPKVDHISLSKLLKVRKLDNYYINKILKRFDRLWLQSIYPCIYKWLFLKKYKFFWRKLFLRFIYFGPIDDSKKIYFISQKFRNSWLDIKANRVNDLLFSKESLKKKKEMKYKIDSSFDRLFHVLLYNKK